MQNHTMKLVVDIAILCECHGHVTQNFSTTNMANSKISFLHHNLKSFPEKLKQTAYFSLNNSFMEYGTTVWDPYQKYNSDKFERVQ